MTYNFNFYIGCVTACDDVVYDTCVVYRDVFDDTCVVSLDTVFFYMSSMVYVLCALCALYVFCDAIFLVQMQK